MNGLLYQLSYITGFDRRPDGSGKLEKRLPSVKCKAAH